MRIFLWFYGKNMTLRDTDDVILGKISNLTRTAQSGVNLNGFLSKLQSIFILVLVVAV